MSKTLTPQTPWGPVPAAPAETEMVERILDAAYARFARDGIAATTMSRLATDVGISRVWLYRHFPNRDAVVTALVAREAQRFLAGLRDQFVVPGHPLTLVRDGFVYSVTFLRGHEVLQRILVTEPDNIAPFLVTQAGPLMRLAAEAVAGYLAAGGLGPRAEALLVAETLTRLALSVALTGQSSIDFDDPSSLQDYATRLIARLI